MNMSIDRLLRAARNVTENVPDEMPFGFDTRVLACLRASDPLAGVTQLLRRVVVLSIALIVLAGAGAWREMNQGARGYEILGEDYAFADSAMGGVVEQ